MKWDTYIHRFCSLIHGFVEYGGYQLFLKWFGALRFSFLVGYGLYACCKWIFGAICCHWYFYEHGNDLEDLLNYFEAVLPYTTIEKWSFFSVINLITIWRIDVQIKTCFLPWRVLISMSTWCILSLGEIVVYN